MKGAQKYACLYLLFFIYTIVLVTILYLILKQPRALKTVSRLVKIITRSCARDLECDPNYQQGSNPTDTGWWDTDPTLDI